MVVRIEFDTDNDAFVGRRKDEICKVLRDCIKGVKEGKHNRDGEFSLRDTNGNRIGFLIYTDK
jgi:hypothetical protein